jgi:hypothetical protein
LLATGIGCDCYPGGVTGFGPKAAFEAVKALAGQTHDQRNDRLACELADNTKLVVNDKLVFRCFADSLVYEPTRAGYMHQQPATLDSYLADSKAAIFTTIVPGPTVLECVGCMGNQHSFLQAEGSYTCSKCQGILCRHCLWELKVLDRASAQCMPCA